MGQVLIVDDEQQVRSMLRIKMEQCGYEVDEAANGEEALTMLNRDSYKVVISDIVMPERDGLEVIIFLRKQRPETRVIAISAPGNQLFLESARALGAAQIFEKPFTLDEIATAVHGLMSL